MKLSLKCRRLSVVFASCLLASCASVGLRDDVVETPTVTPELYAQNKAGKAVVLLDVNWGRQWGCAGYENAQIITFSFDRMPSNQQRKKGDADLVLTTPIKLPVKPTFINYAFLLEPGEYALSYMKIKVARSTSNVGYLIADRNILLKDGKSHGSFRINAGETVYIGNFFLDCYKQPLLWRYYTEKENFQAHVSEYKKIYSFLDLSNVIYRLFDTEGFGRQP